MWLTATLIVLPLLPFAATQTENLDLECNILQTLDDLQNRLASAERHVVGQSSEISQLREELASSGTELGIVKEALTSAETKITTLTHTVTELASRTTHSTYIRWGRTSCPGNGSELVYAGYAGGSNYSHVGAAVDYLCLPTNPDFSHYEDNVQTGGYVFGAEYSMIHNRADGMAFFPGSDQSVNLAFQDVPCAVCRTARSTVLMVPAKTACHNGWTLEYKGYLSSGRTEHTAASQYVCLDDKPEYIPGGSTLHYISKLFHLVEGRCGSLKCPPYKDGRELTCAVCSF